MKKYKVLVTYVEAGMGHIVTAEALANALETYYPDTVEVVRCSLFSETEDPVLRRHEKQLVNIVKQGNRHKKIFPLLMWLQSHFFSAWGVRFLYKTLYRPASKRAIPILASHRPDMVVSTHFTPPILCHMANHRKKQPTDMLNVLYVPDPNVHCWWDNRVDLLLVNNPGAYKEATEQMGFDKERVMLSRFVLRSEVKHCTKDKTALRQKHGLPTERFTVTLACGAYAEGHLTEFANALLALNKPLTLLIIAGTNEAVYEEFHQKIGACGQASLFVYRFRPDAHELYGASDLFITKAGPNAILDSIAMGTPVLSNYYSSPIERITKELYIDTHGVGVHIEDPAEAAAFVSRHMDDPEGLRPYAERAARFVSTMVGGEKEMADRMVALLKERKPRP